MVASVKIEQNMVDKRDFKNISEVILQEYEDIHIPGYLPRLLFLIDSMSCIRIKQFSLNIPKIMKIIEKVSAWENI